MSADEMRTKVEDYDNLDQDFSLDIECDFCDDRGCEECHPDDFAQMYLKYSCDGSNNIEEAIEALEQFISDLREYQNKGFELTEPVDSAYFWLERVNQGAERTQSSSSEDSATPLGR